MRIAINRIYVVWGSRTYRSCLYKRYIQGGRENYTPRMKARKVIGRENYTRRKRGVIPPAIPALGQLTKFEFFCAAGKITPPRNSSAIALQIHYAYTCSSQSGATCTGTGCVVYWGNSPFRTTALMRHPFFRGARLAVHMRAR